MKFDQSKDIFGFTADNPPYRIVGLSSEGSVQIEKISENWENWNCSKKEEGYKYLQCKSNGAIWYGKELIVDKKPQAE